MNDWKQEWVPSEKDTLLYNLAKHYHEETEAFDRRVCTGPIIQGAITPMTTAEVVAINRNAIAVRQKLYAEAASHGITRDELRHAISHFD